MRRRKKRQEPPPEEPWAEALDVRAFDKALARMIRTLRQMQRLLVGSCSLLACLHACQGRIRTGVNVGFFNLGPPPV